MNLLISLAILAQTLDATQTCIALKNGTEQNPFLPQSCKGIIAIKAGINAPLFIFKGKNQKIWAVSMIASGSAGIILTLRFK